MHRPRTRGLVLAALLVAATSSAISSCVFETRTNLCAQFDIRCKEGQECAANQAACIPIGGCGNGIREGDEVCDDGNIVDGEKQGEVFVPDGCSQDCMSTQQCGNDKTDQGEECDHGTANGDANDSCDATCHFVSKVCGNGIVDDVGEACDSGEVDSRDCNSVMAGANGCKAPKCGDSYRNEAAGEECESGGVDTRECNGKTLCSTPICGDDYVNRAADEECESGGVDTGSCNGFDALALQCRSPLCGDGYVNRQFKPAGSSRVEECDNLGGGDLTDCNGNNGGENGPGSCRRPACGDGYTNMQTGEQCDSGSSDSATCNGGGAPASVRCKEAVCGDNYRNRAGEDCDSNSGTDTMNCNGSDALDVACKFSRCGDGYRNPRTTEECDEGDADSMQCNGSSAGDASCKPPECGDSHINHEAGEQCERSMNCPTGRVCQGCQCVLPPPPVARHR